MNNSNTSNKMAPPTPQVFSDEELSEIFQINFAEIFGNPDASAPAASNYKGISLPTKSDRG